MCQSNDNKRRKQVGISCVKQSDKPKYVAHVLVGAVSKKYRQYRYYDTPKYVVHILGEAASDKHTCSREHKSPTETMLYGFWS